MAKIISQLKVDNDSLKSKVDVLSSQKAAYANQFEL